MQRFARVEGRLNYNCIRRHAGVARKEFKHCLRCISADGASRWEHLDTGICAPEQTTHLETQSRNIATHLTNRHFLLAETQVDHWHEKVHCHELRERLEAAADFEAHALDLVLAFFIPEGGRIGGIANA
jgi:hypothetical protein